MRCLPTAVFGSRVVHYSTALVRLRPYQEHCLVACTDALASGATRIGVSLPTGSGKTTVFISLLSRISTPAASPTASAEQVTKILPHCSVEIEQGSKYRASGLADVTVATYQTLLRSERIKKFDPETIKAVIVDEAHHAAAPSYRRILSYFDSSIKGPEPPFASPSVKHQVPIIGFSATFSRHDGLALGSVFEQIVYHRDFLEMIKEQWLCNVRFTSVKADIDLESVTVNSRTGDFNPSSLASVINTETMNELVVRTWIDRASNRKSTLIFCVNISHVMALTKTFRGHGIDARSLYSETPMAERKALIASFKAGEFPVLINCAILTEGADIPNIDCVVVARPTRSRNVFIQMIGRGMRLSMESGKTDCLIIDFVDSMDRMAGVVSTPTLFGLNPGEIDIDDETLESLERRATQAIISGPWDNIPQPTSVTFIDYEDPFSLFEEESDSPHMSFISRNAWVRCGDAIYVLECLGKGHLRVEHVGGTEDTKPYYRGHFTPAMSNQYTATPPTVSPYMRRRAILRAENLRDAIRGCDTYAQAKFARDGIWNSLLRSASWRKNPASDSQKELIAKRWRVRPGSQSGFSSEEERMEKIHGLTKGQAADILTRLRHGAQIRFEKKMIEYSRKEHKTRKEQGRVAREVVKVGPLPVDVT